jgi:hypothetical protein
VCFPLWHGLSNCTVLSFVPYSCLFSRICAAYADVELLDLIYLVRSLNLKPIALPDCPTYTFLHVSHFTAWVIVPVFSSVQLLLYCVGWAKANFYIGMYEQISYPSDQWAVVCKGYPFTSLCYYFLLLLCLGLFLFLLFPLYYLCFQVCQYTNWKFVVFRYCDYCFPLILFWIFCYLHCCDSIYVI